MKIRFHVWMLALALLGTGLPAFTGAALGQSQDAPRIHQRTSPAPLSGGAPAPATAGDSLTLEAVLVPAVGTEAVFTITETMETRVTEQSGIFALAPSDSIEESSAASVRVRYTVLPPDPASGNPRLRVQAVPLDHRTGLPTGPHGWEATYVLTPGDAEFEGGSDVAQEYRDLVAPEWLADWLLTSTDDLPQGDLRPGAEWRAVPDLANLDDLPFDVDAVSLTGKFIGWLDYPEAAGPVAHLSETFTGSGKTEEPLTDGIMSQIHYDLRGTSDYWLVPGQFPYGAAQHLGGGGRIVVGPETGAPVGVSGSLTFRYDYRRTISWDPAGLLTWVDPMVEPGAGAVPGAGGEAAAGDGGAGIPAIEPGATVAGALGPGSTVLPDGSYAEVYTFHGTAGDEVSIRMASRDFDAYVLLLDGDEGYLDHDDDSAGGTDALLRTTLPYTGLYYVVANSAYAGDGGSFTLTVEVARGIPGGDATGGREAGGNGPGSAGSWSGPANIDIARAAELVARLQNPGSLSDAELQEAATLLENLLALVYYYQMGR